jgi:sigma-B regulation protein RsbU (phosphoserine phosphatase)
MAGSEKLFGKYPIKVLLIDDQVLYRDMISEMMKSEPDISFHFSEEPFKGFQMAREIEPTVILLDLVMPNVDGMTMVKYFKSHNRLSHVPLIVLSSREDADTKAEAFAAGVNDYLVKLPHKIELIARIRYHSAAYTNLLERNDAYEALVQSQKNLSRELQTAAEYIYALLPLPLTEGPIKTEWRFNPCTQLGGDAFGYHWIDDDHFAVYLLDVCGHGIGSALLSVTALNVLRTQTLPNADFRDPVQVLEQLNDVFAMEKHNNLYFTLWYGVYQKSTRTLSHASAGHPAALLYSNDQTVPRELLAKNLFIGGFKIDPFEKHSVTISSGDRLYIFSDGVYEVCKPNRELWGFKALKAHFSTFIHEGPDELDRLYRFLAGLAAGPTLQDDFSVVKLVFD